MAKYHINNNDEVKPCRAKIKCPLGTEDDHYDNQEDALKSLENKIEMEQSISIKRPQKRPSQLSKALSSKLIYKGEEPEWFKSIKEESLKRFGKSSEIIDEIDIEGRPTLVVWHDDSLRKNDRGPQRSGYHVSRIEYLDKETGSVKAYLNAMYSSDESSERAFRNDEYTGLRYLASETSDFYYFDEAENIEKLRKLKEDEEGSEETYNVKSKLWVQAMGSDDVEFRKDGLNRWSVSSKDVPKDERDLDKDIEEILEQAQKSYKISRSNSRTPKIDYSNVEMPFRGKGIGSSLYIYAAKKLAEKDLVLASSSLQSDDATKVWKRMGEDTKIPMKVISTKYTSRGYSQTAERFAIDFRKQQG